MAKNRLVMLTAALKNLKGVAALAFGIPAAGILGVVGAAASVMNAQLTLIFLKITNALTAAAG
jgi:hypothetical protein